MEVRNGGLIWSNPTDRRCRILWLVGLQLLRPQCHRRSTTWNYTTDGSRVLAGSNEWHVYVGSDDYKLYAFTSEIPPPPPPAPPSPPSPTGATSDTPTTSSFEAILSATLAVALATRGG